MSRLIRLLVEPHSIAAWEGRRGQWQETAHFDDSAAGLSAFGQFLHDHRTQACSLLINLPDERFSLTPIPRLRGSERRVLLQRRRQRMVDEGGWHALTRHSTGTDQEILLSLQLLNPQQLSPWLERLRAAGSALIAVHLFPQLLAALACRQKQRGVWMICTRHRAGIRLTVVRDGRLIDSQLLPENLSTPDQIEQHANIVIDRLQTQERLPRTLTWQFAEPGDHGLRPVIHLSSSGHSPLASIFALPERRWPTEQIAPSTLLSGARADQLARRCRQIALAYALTTTLASAALLAGDRWLHTRPPGWEAEHEALIREIDTLDHPLADTHWDAAALQRLDDAYQAIVERRAMLPDFLYQLSQHLDRHPEIELLAIDWEIGLEQLSTATNWQVTLHGWLGPGAAGNRAAALPLLIDSLARQYLVTRLPLSAAPLSGEPQTDHPFALQLQPASPP